MTTWACLHACLKNQQKSEDKARFVRGRADYVSEDWNDYLLQINTRNKIIGRAGISEKWSAKGSIGV